MDTCFTYSPEAGYVSHKAKEYPTHKDALNAAKDEIRWGDWQSSLYEREYETVFISQWDEEGGIVRTDEVEVFYA